MNHTIYKAPVYLNDSTPRKQYVIEIGEIEWDADVIGFNNIFIYETSIDPFDFDDGDSMYGVSEEFYAELAETLATNVCDFWNEPEIISIAEII